MTATKKTKKKRAETAEYKSDENVLAIYLRDISHIPLLSREEEIEAAKAAARGDMTARNRLAGGNLRFVINIAKKYQGRGLPLSDLISEGNVGLMNAIDRYNVNMGCRFITFAVWWIRQSILKAIYEKSRMIRLPVNRTNDLIKITRAHRVIGENLSAEKEAQEIAALLNMEKEYVEDIIKISRRMISLEKTIDMETYSLALVDLIEDGKYSDTPDNTVLQDALKEEIESVLDTIDEKEAAVIRYHFGLGKDTPSTLEEISNLLNLSKERVRQIEKKALSKLQNIPRMQQLAAFVA